MFILHRQRSGEVDFERLWLGLLTLAGLLAAAWTKFDLKTPPCLLHAFTGLPCPTCGGTRCMKNLLAGHFVAALSWNPLVFFCAMAAMAYVIYALAAVVLRLPRIRLGIFSPQETHGIRVAAAVVLAANWLYLVHHFSRVA